jgi:hypothetical protein
MGFWVGGGASALAPPLVLRVSGTTQAEPSIVQWNFGFGLRFGGS